MSVEKEIEYLVLTALKTDNTIYEPTLGDMMCFYTPHGVYGPVPFESHAYYSTFSVQSKVHNSNCIEAAHKCIKQMRMLLDNAKYKVSKAANNDISFVHVRFFNLRSRICRSYVFVAADVCVASSYMSSDGVLDALLDF